MRKANQERQILRDDEGNLIAICFGFDFCCEHECGTKALYERLGVSGPTRELQGVKSRQITQYNDEDLVFKTIGDDTILVWDPIMSYRSHVDDNNDSYYKEVPRSLQASTWKPSEEDAMWTSAWTSGPGTPSFGLRFRNKDAEVLKELHEAFTRKDISLWTLHGAFGGRGGLVLAITSKVPSPINHTMESADKEAFRLSDASDATGILKRLADAGKGPYKGYYACSP